MATKSDVLEDGKASNPTKVRKAAHTIETGVQSVPSFVVFIFCDFVIANTHLR